LSHQVVKLEEADDRNTSEVVFLGVMEQGEKIGDQFEPRRKGDS
jgi:hypothetical protein